MKIQNRFSIGDTVYLISDPDQIERKVLYILINSLGLMYGLRVDGELADFFEIELSSEKKY